MKKVICSALAATIAATSLLAVPTFAAEADLAGKTVGICIYQYADNFMSLYRAELQRYLEEKGLTVKMSDGGNDQALQTNQIDGYIADGVDVLIINPVAPGSCNLITDKAKEAGIPLVYINREPTEEQCPGEEDRWEKEDLQVCYVGANAKESGTMQGQIIVDLGLDAVDLNKNGKVDYLMIEGDPENIDAQYRTQYSIEALVDAGIEVNEVDDQVGFWDQAQGNTLVANALAMYDDEIEVVFCNNDAMALGALQAIESANRKVGEDIFLVGVDALGEACQNVLSGRFTGTVFNDHIGQADAAADAAINYLTGEGNEHIIMVPYRMVTAENAQDILDILG